MSKNRLVPQNITHGGMQDLSDSLYLIAREIETAFILMDATPGVDYTRKDLMELAMQYAINGGDFAVDTTIFD